MSKASLERINRELHSLVKGEGAAEISAGPKGDDPTQWVASVMGPIGTAYEGGVFFLSVDFPDDYPNNPPTIKFLTKIYHMNVGENGAIQLDVLGDNWSPALTVAKVLLSIVSLLHDPNPSAALRKDLADLYMVNPAKYSANAAGFTHVHAS
jgi:ubiquitin-conjugating enzyme E2 D/E